MNATPTRVGIEWDESELLLRDLRLLLKRDGFVPHRVARATTLRQILGGADESYEIARERFVSAIESLREPFPQMLLEVFALTPDVENLAGLPARYEHYGARVGLKIDAVRKQVSGALDLLRNQLTTGWYPKSPLPFRIPESHNGVDAPIDCQINFGRFVTRELTPLVAGAGDRPHGRGSASDTE
jgi:hypothetical protein